MARTEPSPTAPPGSVLLRQHIDSAGTSIPAFALAAGMGAIKQSSGSYQLALWLFASLGVLAWFGLHGVKRRWRTTWGSAAVTAARV